MRRNDVLIWLTWNRRYAGVVRGSKFGSVGTWVRVGVRVRVRVGVRVGIRIRSGLGLGLG